jgi:6-phosphogluconolactonase/glucosamine-6-phosphate isomerase/deaminase
MKFLREDTGVVSHEIARVICDGLFANKRVLWLVSGGSNLAAEKDIMDMARNHADGHLRGLAIMPVDERYGHPGHDDSNIQQLRDAGFDPGSATFIDVLLHDTPFDETVSFYNELANAALANADLVVGQFGMGADGHIAGIKPDSPAADSDVSTVTGYNWSDYQRLTLMPAALRQITVGFLLAYGSDKKKTLLQLQKNKLPFHKLPAVLLYEIPEMYVYNDQIESED